MKRLAGFAKAGMIALAVMLSPTHLYADDTEIFFSRAKADNEQNEPIANVLIMLDTSGSMRYCEKEGSVSGYNASWCADYKKRRINVLQESLKEMLADVPDGVRIGLGRFNYNVNDVTKTSGGTGQIGGRVLVPVMDVTDAARALMFSEIDKLNAAGNNAAAAQPGFQPVGDTPTGRAYAEAARYMMGLNPVYGVPGNGAETGVCVETATREIDCTMVFDGYTDWEKSEECDITLPTCKVEYGEDWMPSPGCDTSLESCSAEYGEWQPVGFCDVASETCRVEDGNWQDIAGTCNTANANCRLGGWNDWVVTRASGANNGNCRTNQNTSTFERRRVTVCNGPWWWPCRTTTDQCEERTRSYQQRGIGGYFERSITYFERDSQYFSRAEKYKKVCGIETYCAKYADIVSGGKYVSPMNMENQCESNHVILFTDGTPSGNDNPGNQGFVNCGSKSSYDCQVQISSYLHSDANAKKRKVKTYNIGLYMGNNEVNMRKVSTDGEEGTINADDGEQLLKAFSSIVDLIADNSRSFSAPGVAVNQMNRLEHLDQLYYSVFEPRRSSYWEGNLKRYRINRNSSTNATEWIVDQSDAPAVDPDTAFFKESSQSFWSEDVDGPDVRKGGAREQLESRRLFYSNAAGEIALLDWDNTNNPKFFGLSGDASEEDLALVKNRLKTMWGDPLHSEPVLVNYGGGQNNNVVFVSANDGMLRGIRTTDGTEVFSFMPHEFISQADRFTINRPGLDDDNARLLYGLDGSWTAWRRSGSSVSSAPNKVYLYGGMRRGGDSYFALDVTNILKGDTVNAPSMMWSIDSTTSGFERIGQTWSQPSLTQVMVNGNKRPVLVFGGGYDPEGHDRQQKKGRRAAGDEKGNMLYIVDALTGKLIWSAGSQGASTTVPDMKWSIPSNIAVVDANFDGVANFLYFGDLGGQIFRIDLDQDDVESSKVHRLASLGGTGAANNRRFFYPPAVTLHRDDETKQESLYFAIGSGYRAHPLDESVDDYFYVIRDDSVAVSRPLFTGNAPTSVIGPNDLSELTTNAAADAGKAGWRLPLVGSGEKSLSAATVFAGSVLFTTYEPGSDQVSANPCAVRMGTSYLYAVNLVTGKASDIVDGDDSDRRRELTQDVPPPAPIYHSDGDSVTVIIGTEIIGEADLGNTGMRRGGGSDGSGGWYQLKPKDADRVPKQPRP